MVIARVGAQNEVLADLTWRDVPGPDSQFQEGFWKTGDLCITGCLSDGRNGGHLVFGSGLVVLTLCLQTPEGYLGIKGSLVVPHGCIAEPAPEPAPRLGAPRGLIWARAKKFFLVTQVS